MVDLALIDTTEFTKSPLLRSNGWPDLLKRSRSGQLHVVVSEVSLRESARQFEEAIAKEVAGLARAAAKVERQYGLSVPDLQHLDTDAAGAAEGYLDRVRRDLEDSDVEILPILATSHDLLIERDLGRRRPFDGSGRGYRDALIWESLLAKLEMSWSPLEVVIVTGNTNDFGGTRSGLAGDLHEDLSEIDPPMVGSLVTTLPALLRLLAPLPLPKEVSRVPELSTEAIDAVSTALIGASEVLEGAVSYQYAAELGLEPDLVEDLEVEWISVDRDSVECVVYDSYEGDTFAVSATTHADIGFEGLVDRREAYRLDRPWEVIDSDWTDQSVLVRAEGELTLHFNLIVAGNDVQDVTFDYAEAG